MKIDELLQSSNIITMWHGGRGLEYSYREMQGWNNQTIVVIFNPKIIANVKIMKAKDVTLDMRELEVDI